VVQQAIGQDDHVLDSQRRPQPDGEMSGVSTIPGQHDLAVMPAPIADIPEVEPLGRRTIGNLPDELVTAQIILEKPFHHGKRLVVRHRVEAQASPGLAGTFHHECARGGIDPIRVRPHPAAIGLDENKGKGLEYPIGP
jgi:hypothetical protein